MYHSLDRSKGYVSLRVALKNERPEAAKSLLKSGCEVNREKHGPRNNTALHFAAMHGYIEIVQMMLDLGADTKVTNKSGKTPLHVAINSEKMKVAELLLKRGANANAADKHGISLLHAASSYEKCSEIVKHLLGNGARVSLLGWHASYTPLHFAVGRGDEGVVTLLLSKGVNVDVKTKNGVTPLHIAAEKGYTSIAEELLNYGACIDSVTLSRGYTPLHFAIENGQRTVVKLLLQHGAKIDNEDKSGKTILYLAVETGCSTIVEDVLKYCPATDNQSNRNSLKIPVYNYSRPYENILESLLEYGFDFNPEDTDNPKLLHAAVGQGYLKIVEHLLKYGVDVNVLHDSTFKGFTPLHTAAKQKQEQVAKLLISYEADINAQNETGKTPIFYAIQNADLKITKLLLTHGANVKDSPELLHIAAKKQCIEIVEALLQHDADINASDEYGRTALRFAVSSLTERWLRYKASHEDTDITINLEIVGLLLSKGANVNAEQKSGWTALHIAAQNGNKEVVNVLLEFDADINCRNEYGMTPLHIACYKGHSEVVETLLEYGSDVNIMSRNNLIPLEFAIYGRTSFYTEVNRYDYNNEFSKYYDHDDNDYDSNDNDDDDNDNDFYSERGVRSYEVIAEALERHIVKLESANLYVSYKNLRSVNDIHDFEHECKKEIADMKSEKIYNANISFYDILTIRTSSLEMYMRNENIVQILKSDDYKRKFPIYASMIECHFRKSMKRKELLEQANEICHFLFNNFPALPYDCTEKIFSHLSDEDLRIFIDACKPLSICNPNANMDDVAITSNISQV